MHEIAYVLQIVALAFATDSISTLFQTVKTIKTIKTKLFIAVYKTEKKKQNKAIETGQKVCT
jgi:hypothetical protein